MLLRKNTTLSQQFLKSNTKIVGRGKIDTTILNILCLKFKIIAFFITTLFARLHARVGILLTCGKLMHDRIISPTGEVCAIKRQSQIT
jgi:hypothetical protein